MSASYVIFVINLLQDVNIVRPLVYMAALDLGRPTLLMVSAKFRIRDKSGTWQKELAGILRDTGATLANFTDEVDAIEILQDKAGLLIAASESHLVNHKLVHDLMAAAPSSLLKITLQHGFECVGFLQSQDQNQAHGRNITFAADIIGGWCTAERLKDIAPSQRHKLYVTGPAAVLQRPAPSESTQRFAHGLVCENLHSPRMNTAGDFKGSFLEIFGQYCSAQAADGRMVALRPHPGGQYTLKKKVPLPGNVVLENAPIYKVDLSRYAYGISAPSSIIIDMVLAGIPVAVWQDEGSLMDMDNYAGLTHISKLQDWLDFSREAVAHPERYLAQQQDFLKRQQMPTEPEVVYRHYAELLGCRNGPARLLSEAGKGRERILYVANDIIATLQLSFIRPLEPLVTAGNVVEEVLTEAQMTHLFGKKPRDEVTRRWLSDRFEDFQPTLVVFCRYSGPHAAWMLELAEKHDAPVIYHIDDDLLHIPVDIGQKKHQYHNQPERLASVRLLLDEATLVYCSTPRLAKRLESLSVKAPLVTGKIYCSGQVMSPAMEKPVRRIGYMASSGHGNDFLLVSKAIARYLKQYKEVELELFGSISPTSEFKEFAGRVRQVPKVDNYKEFMQRLAEREWDIGICPLASIDFNLMKANTKWVEYTAVGAAVVASGKTVYDTCCEDGGGILAETEDEWYDALVRLTENPALRVKQVRRAQDKLSEEYSLDRLRGQVLDVFYQANNVFVMAKTLKCKV